MILWISDIDLNKTFSTNPVQSVEKTFQLRKAYMNLLAKPESELQVVFVKLYQHIFFKINYI